MLVFVKSLTAWEREDLRKALGETEEGIPSIIALYKSGKCIEAIKKYRKAMNCGLKEARDFLEAQQRW